MPFVTRNQVRIHYEVRGEGPPVVFLPGLGGNIQGARLSGFDMVLPHHRLILVEPRGHGESDKPRDPKAHRLEEYRDDVRAVLDELHVSKAVSWGFSDGGQIGYALADAYPNRISALIDVDGIDDMDLCEPPLNEGRLGFAQATRTATAAQRLEALATFGADPKSAAAKNHLNEDPEMVALELEAWTHWKGPITILPRLHLPLLICLNSGRTPEEIARIRAAAGAQAQILVVPGTTHWDLCYQPRHIMPTVNDFLARVPS